MKNTILLLALLVSHDLLSQKSQLIDSLRGEYLISNDTSKVIILCQLADQLKYTNPDTAIWYARKSLKEGYRANFIKKKSRNYRIIGIAFTIKEAYNEAIQYHDSALMAFNDYFDENEYLLTLSNQSIAYYRTGAYEKAVKNYFLTLKRYKEMGALESVGKTYSNLCNVYRVITDYPSAIKYGKESLQIFNQINNYKQSASVLNNLGMVFKESGQPDSARIYFTRSRDLFVQYGFDSTPPEFNLANLYFELGQFERACDIFYKYSQDESLMRNPMSERHFLTGSCHCDLVYNLTDKAIKKAEYLEAKHRKEGEMEFKVEINELLSILYFRKGNFKEAYKLREKWMATRDSMSNNEIQQELSRAKIEFEVYRKEQEIRVQEKENQILKQDRNVIALSSSLAILLSISFLYRSRIRRRIVTTRLDSKNRELTSKLIQVENTNDQLNKIKNILESPPPDISGDQILKKVNKLIRQLTEKEQSWQIVVDHFNEVSPLFFEKLKAINPELSLNDIKMCVFIKHNLSTKELAEILNITPRSVQTARYRLKKSLNLDANTDLIKFIRSL